MIPEIKIHAWYLVPECAWGSPETSLGCSAGTTTPTDFNHPWKDHWTVFNPSPAKPRSPHPWNILKPHLHMSRFRRHVQRRVAVPVLAVYLAARQQQLPHGVQEAAQRGGVQRAALVAIHVLRCWDDRMMGWISRNGWKHVVAVTLQKSEKIINVYGLVEFPRNWYCKGWSVCMGTRSKHEKHSKSQERYIINHTLHFGRHSGCGNSGYDPATMEYDQLRLDSNSYCCGSQLLGLPPRPWVAIADPDLPQLRKRYVFEKLRSNTEQRLASSVWSWEENKMERS